jgi:hypothetical protein
VIARSALLLSFVALARAQDPTFRDIPFDDWVSHPQSRDHFQWSVHVTGGILTNFQRLMARVDLFVDAAEIAKRKGRGELKFYLQFTGSDQRKFQTHGGFALTTVHDETIKSRIVYTQTAFVVPGDYQIDVAIQDTGTGEHSVAQRSLHVSRPRGDPLPNADQSLPLVEFHTSNDSPDLWFLPEATGLLNLPVQTSHPIQVELLANVAPSAIGPRFRGGRLPRGGLRDILPSFKALWDMSLTQGRLRASLIDISRRQVVYAQEHGKSPRALNWAQMKPALVDSNPNKIDVKELAERHSNPQFFVQEVRKRLGPKTALVIISTPVTFVGGDDRKPIDVDPAKIGRVFFIRFHSIQLRFAPQSDTLEERQSKSVLPPITQALEPYDSLLNLVKPLQPRVFDVYSPEGARKALAEIIKELERM